MPYDVDRRPGFFAKSREATHLRVAVVFVAVVLAAGVLALTLILTRTASIITSGGLIFIGLAAHHFFGARLDQGITWGKGGNAEAAVGAELELLRIERFTVMHDLENVVPGNVDHVVSGPTGVFMIETKFRRYEQSALRKARRDAFAVARELETRWVQPVICVATRSYGPRMVEGVAIVGRKQLLPYIRSQKHPRVSFEQLAKFADRQ